MHSGPEVCGRQVVAIVGMHRSGTSCLAGSLQRAGLQLGEVHTWNPYNRRGNRENPRIVDFNDRLLARHGGAWDRPPAQVRWEASDRDAARALIDGLGVSEVVGFKDPRTLLTVDGWRDCVPGMRFVGVFRDPRRVVRSLALRSDMPAAASIALWHYYNHRLLRLQGELGFPLVDFDLPEAQYVERVSALALQLGLDGVALRARPFFARELRSAAIPAGMPALPYRVRLLHWKLRRRAARQAGAAAPSPAAVRSE